MRNIIGVEISGPNPNAREYQLLRGRLDVALSNAKHGSKGGRRKAAAMLAEYRAEKPRMLNPMLQLGLDFREQELAKALA